MGKMNSNASSHLCHYVSDFKAVFTSDGKVLCCQACGKSFVAQQPSQIIQHLCGSKHTTVILCFKDQPGMQSLIAESSATCSSSEPSKFVTFATDLCEAFVSAATRLFKINNPEVSNFLLKYTQTDPPDESTLWKN
jgi:hypothetical protein